MFKRFARLFQRKNEVIGRATQPLIEGLESRRLLSSVATVQPDYTILAAATSSSNIQGYTPAEIQTAYGFNKVSFSNSSIAADGAGQTIAIVDAYNDPTALADLKVFDNQFALPDPPSFKVVNQTGGSKLPANDSGWAGEIALDVEWAHAIAPQAGILLVEAGSSAVTDLMAAVDTARHASGVSVVSMSWGGSEFFSWGGGESQSQLAYDPYFTTPTGHNGVTFVAAAGDSGVSGGVQWPASSPDVVSVGGTSLTLDSTGNYVSESSWGGTSGGFSVIESQPTYQSAAVAGASTRAVPDVSYDADPNTGFAVYDSTPDQGYVGWQEVGGTSAGTPQWAALIAIADQGRVTSGSTTLDGKSQTLPILYSLYTASTTSTSTSSDSGAATLDYANSFNDVVDSTFGGGYHWRWGGYGHHSGLATTGYDAITGLGSPKADSIVAALIGPASSSGSTGAGGSSSGSGLGTGSGSTSGTNSGSTGTTAPAPTALPVSPLSAIFLTLPVDSVLSGTSATLKLRLTNTSTGKFSGPVTIALYASSDAALSSGDAALTTLTLPRISLHAGGSKTIKLRFDYPQVSQDWINYLIASAATGATTANATATTPNSLTISPPTVDLAASSPQQSMQVSAGSTATLILTVQNLGNVLASGSLTLTLYASADQNLDTSDTPIATTIPITIKLKPGRSKTLHIRFTAPAAAAGTSYNLLAAMTSSTTPADANSSNDLAAVSILSL